MANPSAMFINKGDHLVPAPNGKGEELLAKMPKAVHVRMTWNRGRSRPHDGLFFAAIGLACKNWPEMHRFQPDDAEHLRSWLLCEAGHRKTATHEIKHGISPKYIAAVIKGSIEAAQADLAKSKRGHAFIIYTSSTVQIWTPKTMKHMKVGRKEFTDLSQKVSEILKVETGLDLSDYKAQLKKKEGDL